MSERITAEVLGRLLADHGPALALLASQWTEAADDCVQEALIELAALPSVPDRPAAWLFKRVRQRALNALRSAARRREYESAGWRERLVATGSAIDRGEVFDLVEALANLSAGDRELVTLRFYSGLSYAEAAEVLGSSSSSVHRRTEKALRQLRQHLESPCQPKNHPSNSPIDTAKP